MERLTLLEFLKEHSVIGWSTCFNKLIKLPEGNKWQQKFPAEWENAKLFEILKVNAENWFESLEILTKSVWRRSSEPVKILSDFFGQKF